jgi:poly(3-hydroxybutyrate) depolymerase
MILAGACLLLLSDGISTERGIYEGRQREVAVFLPRTRDRSEPLPLVVLLHGSGGDGRLLVRSWKGVASAQGFAVAGPTALDRNEWTVPEDGPRFLHELVERLKQSHSIDARRVYLFGHSAGGILALYMGAMEGGYFAAVAAHAAVFAGEAELSGLQLPARKAPVLLMAGTRDRLFPVERARATGKELQGLGVPLTLVELPRGHAYEPSEPIAERAWEFLREHRLSEEPRYVPHTFAPRPK